jgi:two-component system response regulator FixJ
MHEQAPIATPPRHRIAVLDGDPAVRDSLATLMRLDDHAVATYPTAAAFLRALDAQAACCVICEAELPDQSGLQVFLTLRERNPSSRFALLVSRKDSQLLARAHDVGIRDVYFKPLVHRRLLEFVRRG